MADATAGSVVVDHTGTGYSRVSGGRNPWHGGLRGATIEP